LLLKITERAKADIEIFQIPECSQYLKQYHRKTGQDRFKGCVSNHIKITFESLSELSISRGFDSQDRFIWILKKSVVDKTCKKEWDVWHIEPDTYKLLEKKKHTILC